MFKHLNLGPRLVTLIVVQIIVLLLLAAVAFFSLSRAANSTAVLRATVDQNTKLSWMTDSIQGDVEPMLYGVIDGTVSWEEGRNRLQLAQSQFSRVWNDFQLNIEPDEREFVDEILGSNLKNLQQAFKELKGELAYESSESLRQYVRHIYPERVNPFLHAMLASNAEQQITATNIVTDAERINRIFLIVLGAMALIGILISALIGWAIYRSIVDPLHQISETVDGVADGNFDVRTELDGDDELSQLGQAFDGMLDDRLAALATAEKQNDQLNDSVLALLQGVSTLSQRDLTVSVPVTEDVTGPVADAINNMTEQTATVLSRVNRIASEVDSAALSVDEKANSVTRVANAQREEIEQTAEELAQVSVKMAEIASLAERCNDAADVASGTTNEAMSTVNATLSGMNEIRETIQETGKRMKRLGERSNEITEIVDIINTIAERTHVLALNASMQAASAGEAGRGFAVVADEVQRLAESARESTAQISSLVRNIQIDTNDTIATMDRTISNVVDGSRLAEAAGKQMVQTRDATQDLVASVAKIAETSKDQATVSQRIRDRASQVVQRTRSTADELVEQLKQTQNLVGYANNLLSSVSVFKLPESKRSASE